MAARSLAQKVVGSSQPVSHPCLCLSLRPLGLPLVCRREQSCALFSPSLSLRFWVRGLLEAAGWFLAVCPRVVCPRVFCHHFDVGERVWVCTSALSFPFSLSFVIRPSW